MAGLVLSNSVSSNAYEHEYIWCVCSIFVKQPNWGIGEEGNSVSACSWPVSSCWVCKKPSFGWPGAQGRLCCHLQLDRLFFSGLQGSLESISFEEHHTLASNTPQIRHVKDMLPKFFVLTPFSFLCLADFPRLSASISSQANDWRQDCKR